MKVLRPYQSAAVDSVIREWDTVRSTAIICATGTGKSTMGTEVVRRRIPFGRVLWLAHRDELISQARDTIAAMIPEASVGVEQAGSYARVTGFDSLADDVVVASVATLHDKRRSRFDPSRFATIVCDECHHITAKTYGDILKHFASSKVLGLTATPDRGDGVGLGEVIESVAYEYDLQTAIREGYLCPIKAIMIDVAGLDLSSVRTTAGDLNQGQLAKLLEVDRVHHEIASPLVQHAGDRQTIVFATSVEQSKALADVIQGYLSGTGKEVRHLDGTTPAETRKRILREYGSGKVQFLCNVGVLTEGFDAPATSCVALARPTKSRALYAQMVGRGTRLAPGKTDLLVIDFRGSAGKHSLANPVDLLAGKSLPDEVRAIAMEKAKDGKLLDAEAMEEAEKEHAKRLEEADRKRAAAAALQVVAIAKVEAMDLFRASCDPGAPKTKRMVTDGQRRTLLQMGLKADQIDRMTFDQASRQIDSNIQRRKKGLCTYPMARILAKNGMNPDLDFQTARNVLDALKANQWRATGELLAQYGARR